MGGKSDQVAGYRYFMGLHFGLCHGPVDELVEVRGGDLTIWNGSQTVSGPVSLNAPEIYGGDKSEGGVVGTLDVMMGEGSQIQNSYLTLIQGALQTAYRGILSLVFRGGQIGSNNPYPKPWSFRVRRATQGWDGAAWYTGKAVIQLQGAGTEITLSHATTLDLPNNTLLTFGGGTASGYSIGDTSAGGTQINVVVTVGTLTAGMSVTDAAGAIPGGTTISAPASSVIKAMNPAHIIYETLSNRNWGMGYPSSIIDADAFTAAADQLYAEGFGLCLLWQRTDTIEAFLQQVIDHIGAVLVQDITTGKFQLNLIRGGYDQSTLPVFTEADVVEVIDYAGTTITGQTNEMVVTWFDPTTKSKSTTTVQSLGAVQSQGVVVSASKEYAGIPTSDLASRVAQRDLRAVAIPLKRGQFRLNRKGYKLLPGGLFVMNFPGLEIDHMVMRVGDVDYGQLQQGSITVTALQDVFALPTTAFIAPPVSGWTAPDSAPKPPSYAVAMDATYRDLVRTLTPDQLQALQPVGGYAAFMASKPTSLSLGYEFWSRVGAAPFKRYNNGFFAPNGILQSSLQPFDTTMTLELGVDLEIIAALPCAAMIESEIISVTALDPATGIATIARGCVDTVPAAHSAGVRAWLYDNFLSSDQVEYFADEAVEIQPLTYAPAGTLSQAGAPTWTAHIANRQNLPYPPAYLTLNGTRWDLATSLTGTITAAWRGRNRITQMDRLVDQTQAAVTPEAGTTYSVRVLSVASGLPVAQADGITGTNFTFTPSSDDDLTLQVWSMRDGLASLQMQSATFSLTGGAFRRAIESGPDRITETASPRDIMVAPPPPPPPPPPPSPAPPSLTNFNAQDAAPIRAGNKQVIFFRWSGAGSGWDSSGVAFQMIIKRRNAAGTSIVWTIPALTTSGAAAPQAQDQVSNNLAQGGSVPGSAYDGGINYFASAQGITADIQAYQRFSGAPPSDWCEGFAAIDPAFNYCFVLPQGLWTFENNFPSVPLHDTPPNGLDFIEFYAYTTPNLGASPVDPASYFTANTAFEAFFGRNFVDGVTTARPQISFCEAFGDPLPGQVWKVTLSSVDYTYTSIGGDFHAQVCNGLTAAINAGGVYTAATVLVGPVWRVQITGAAGTSYSVATSVT